MTNEQLEEALHQLAKESMAVYRELDKLKQYEAKRKAMVNWFQNWKREG